MNTGDLLTNAARSHPEKIAFIFEETSRTYAQSCARADALARALLAGGLQTGDRVALYLRNCPEFMEILFGTWKAGGLFRMDYRFEQGGARVIMNSLPRVTWQQATGAASSPLAACQFDEQARLVADAGVSQGRVAAGTGAGKVGKLLRRFRLVMKTRCCREPELTG